MIQIDDIVIDIASSEDHNFQNEITDHPVETGSNVTDNAIEKPIQIVINGLVSDYPLGTNAAGFVAPNGDLPTASDTGTQSQTVLAKLLALKSSREPITVIDSLGTWTNMVLESLSVPRTPKTGYALEFRATFKQLVLVTNDRTVVPVSLPRAAAPTTLGHQTSPQPPTNNPSSSAENDRSGLHQLLNYAGVSDSSLGYDNQISTVPHP